MNDFITAGDAKAVRTLIEQQPSEVNMTYGISLTGYTPLITAARHNQVVRVGKGQASGSLMMCALCLWECVPCFSAARLAYECLFQNTARVTFHNLWNPTPSPVATVGDPALPSSWWEWPNEHQHRLPHCRHQLAAACRW